MLCIGLPLPNLFFLPPPPEQIGGKEKGIQSSLYFTFLKMPTSGEEKEVMKQLFGVGLWSQGEEGKIL